MTTTDKLTPLRRHRIRDKVGALDKDVRERLDQALLFVLGMAA